MPATYEPIATTTLSSTANTITFSNIPNTYTDLRIVANVKHTSGRYFVRLQFNGNTNSDYSWTHLYSFASGTTGSTQSSSQSYIAFGQAGSPTENPGFYTADILSYAGNTNKAVLLRESANVNSTSNGGLTVGVGLWRSTNAITSVNIHTTINSFAIGSSATLYGILKA